MRGSKPGRSTPVALRKAKGGSVRENSKQAEELMELAVDAARSKHLPDFLNRFAARAAAMAEADRNCKSYYIVDASVRKKTSSLSQWSEIWIVNACGINIPVSVLFTDDGAGGTYIAAEVIKPK